ncbi:MAG: hypothetical protein HJJLKODD_02662 [Phycisphaerae bacterium]|nr:hypothetical protein [Phycisphaerae bacterium]
MLDNGEWLIDKSDRATNQHQFPTHPNFPASLATVRIVGGKPFPKYVDARYNLVSAENNYHAHTRCVVYSNASMAPQQQINEIS